MEKHAAAIENAGGRKTKADDDGDQGFLTFPVVRKGKAWYTAIDLYLANTLINRNLSSCTEKGREERMASVTSLGLGKTMEKKLHSVGIHSAEDLTEIGSKQAVFRLKEQYPNTCVVILYHLEAAIRGVEIKQLEDRCKAELKAYFKQL